MPNDGTDLPQRVLIHLHIRKTGGTSLNSAVKHAFGRHEAFELYAEGDYEHTSLDIASFPDVSKALAAFGLDRVRYISGHVPFGVHRLFGGRAKYLTLVRDPIERVISTFFWFLASRDRAFCRAGKPLSFEEYLESGDDNYLNNYQVRVLSGAREFDSAVANSGVRELTFGPPVERGHLEEAKRNIVEHFLIAAPLENLTQTVLLLRMMNGWPMRRLHNEYKNQNQNRPRVADLSPRLIKMIERNNVYDLELYEWVRTHFVAQCAPFEPQLSEDLERFGRINRVLTSLGKYLPHRIRKRIAASVLHGRAPPFDFLRSSDVDLPHVCFTPNSGHGSSGR